MSVGTVVLLWFSSLVLSKLLSSTSKEPALTGLHLFSLIKVFNPVCVKQEVSCAPRALPLCGAMMCCCALSLTPPLF